MAVENNFVQPVILMFDGHYDHWFMLMENFLRSKEYWSLVQTGVPDAAKGVELTAVQQKSIADQKLKDLKSSLLVHEQRMNGHGGDEQALKVAYDDRTGGIGGGRARRAFRGRGRQAFNKAIIECYNNEEESEHDQSEEESQEEVAVEDEGREVIMSSSESPKENSPTSGESSPKERNTRAPLWMEDYESGRENFQKKKLNITIWFCLPQL
ncbi:hypothetical protein KIW84_058335 [Lathyrus oleraceus]|uniref:Uncharacterized protein n=1 Tax=Pisum sativum TaxID=3888 RepID=A0A9D4X713_PEA|nr:hypothetical protein KIW84_058335 [Pisum sativum]